MIESRVFSNAANFFTLTVPISDILPKSFLATTTALISSALSFSLFKSFFLLSLSVLIPLPRENVPLTGFVSILFF
jgi:hypothetical protein